MPRPLRLCPDGVPQHVVNRGNLRAPIFLETADYLGFLAALTDAVDRTTVRLLAFCLLPNHWHLVLWPLRGDDISAFMQIAMNAHIRDLQRRHGTSGTGHIYQGRFRSSAILSARHFLNVCRYVEANPLDAGLVQRADAWPWSSLVRCGPADGVDLLTPWPVARPADWARRVNSPLSNRAIRKIEEQIRRSARAARDRRVWESAPTKVAGTFHGKVPATFTSSTSGDRR